MISHTRIQIRRVSSTQEVCSRDDMTHIFYNWRDIQRTLVPRCGQWRIHRATSLGAAVCAEGTDSHMYFTFGAESKVDAHRPMCDAHVGDLIRAARANGYVVAYAHHRLVIIDPTPVSYTHLRAH